MLCNLLVNCQQLFGASGSTNIFLYPWSILQTPFDMPNFDMNQPCSQGDLGGGGGWGGLKRIYEM